MKLELILTEGPAILGRISLQPRGVALDVAACRRILDMPEAQRHEGLVLIAKQVGRAITSEEIFQLCRVVVGKSTSGNGSV